VFQHRFDETAGGHEYGMRPLEAIRTATLNAADLL
jgi:imidazolonepropionase-like amidohydrolase